MLKKPDIRRSLPKSIFRFEMCLLRSTSLCYHDTYKWLDVKKGEIFRKNYGDKKNEEVILRAKTYPKEANCPG